MNTHFQTVRPGWRVGVGACCNDCAQGRPCSGCVSALPEFSVPVHDVALKPGETSFPVGFGQPANAPITTTSVPVAVASSWGIPVTIAVVAGLFGFGVAYFISK